MDNLVITIGRQYGSGGRKIGLLLAETMGLAFWDRKLISEAARRSGLDQEFFKTCDEKHPGILRQIFSFGLAYAPGFGEEEMFRIQAETITELASQGPCVMVGRCADYVLRENPRCVSVFISAPKEERVKRVASRHGITLKEAADMIIKIDKKRAAYYDFYTNRQWGHAASYRLCLDSSVLGLEGSAALIRQLAEQVGR